MAEIIHRRSDCRGCGCAELELFFSLKPTPIGDAYVTADKVDVPQPSYPIDLFMCQRCGLAQLIDVIDPNVLYGDYIYVTASSLGLAEHFGSYADAVIKRANLRPGSLVVDLGSNDGTLLKQFKSRGMNVLGVEPASHIAAEATAAGVKTVDRFFTPAFAGQLAAEFGHAKVVTANNVFANIDDLKTWVDGIDALLAPDGVFVCESYYLADVLQNMVFDFIYHEHLSAFSVRPIQALFERAGLELAAVQRVPTKGGSLRYFVHRPGGPVANDGSVAELLALEDRMGLYRKETYSAFAAKVDGLKDKTKALLTKLKAEGKSIAGFGASITGTTLIYHFEIGEFLDFLADDNPAKQGRFSPGLHLPVLPSTSLCQRKPDYVVILAWRFAGEIIRKNQAYLDGGGHFIVPVPELRVT
ncbi:MAG: class I SAM-dependent methyltransferase [Reyranella sp.]|nr:class I SAM-dependent methyltransferase [Reyranella sp.]